MTSDVTAPTATRTPQHEAIELLSEVVKSLSEPGADLKILLRKVVHIGNLLGLEEIVGWAQQEFYGYVVGSTVPWYRTGIPATRRWRPEGMYALVEQRTHEMINGEVDASTENRDVYWGVGLLLSYTETGVWLPVGEQGVKWLPHLKKEVQGREVVAFSKASIARVIENLENEIFRWASSTYISLGFGNAVSDIWHESRIVVDVALSRLGFDGHMRQIQAGLASEDPEAWRLAMLGCRNLIHDLASHLWRDPRKTYENLPGEDGQPIQVTEDKYVNRIIAYLHQKGVVDAAGEFLRADWRRLRRLNDLASSAKNPVKLADARLTAVNVYVLLGELASRTDMIPIETYV